MQGFFFSIGFFVKLEMKYDCVGCLEGIVFVMYQLFYDVVQVIKEFDGVNVVGQLICFIMMFMGLRCNLFDIVINFCLFVECIMVLSGRFCLFLFYCQFDEEVVCKGIDRY